MPGGSKFVDMVNESKTRLDEMQKKLRGLDELEKRVAKLEKQVAATAKPAPKPEEARRAQAGGSEDRLRWPSAAGTRRRSAPRHDLEPHRRRARLLAVELDRQRRVGVDGDDGAAQELGLRVRQVRAAVGLRQRHEQVALGQVADREHVEEAVVRLRVGADDHPAAEGLAVRDDDVVHAAAADSRRRPSRGAPSSATCAKTANVAQR